MAAGGQAAALGVKRRPFAAKIKKLTINTRATPSRAGGGGGGRKTQNQIFIALPNCYPSNGPEGEPVLTANTHVFMLGRVFHLNARIRVRFSRIRHM